MENEEIQKSIAERFDNLQPEIQNLIMSDDYIKSLIDIIQKYSLTEEQIGEFELNTTLVLLGEIHPDKYKSELAQDLKISNDILNKIVSDVDQKILGSVKSIILENWRKDDRKEAESIDAPPPPYKESKISTEENIENPPKTPYSEEENVLQKSGVEISKEEIEKIPLPKKDFLQNENKTLVDSGIDLIEEKEEGSKNNILKDKIINTSITTHNTSDRSKDSYREPIE